MFICTLSLFIYLYIYLYIYIYIRLSICILCTYIYIFGYTSIYTSTILELGWKTTPNSACLPRHWVKVFFMDFLMVKQVFVVPWLFKRGRWKGQNKWTFSGWWFEILFPLFIPICSNIGFFWVFLFPIWFVIWVPTMFIPLLRVFWFQFDPKKNRWVETTKQQLWFVSLWSRDLGSFYQGILVYIGPWWICSNQNSS